MNDLSSMIAPQFRDCKRRNRLFGNLVSSRASDLGSSLASKSGWFREKPACTSDYSTASVFSRKQLPKFSMAASPQAKPWQRAKTHLM